MGTPISHLFLIFDTTHKMAAINRGIARSVPAATCAAQGRASPRSFAITTKPLRQRRDIATNAVKNLESLAQFEEIVSNAGDQLVVVDIATTWCGPCKMIYPVYEQFSDEFGDKAVFLKLMGDATPDTNAIMKDWGVKAVPEFHFIKNKEVMHKQVGSSEKTLKANIEKYL